MLNLVCGSISLPLCVVSSISWTKRARTVSHQGGYVSSIGFETAEISVKLHAEYTILTQLGVDADEVWGVLSTIATDRESMSGVFYLGGYPIYPELEFTPTNINRTILGDTVQSGILELDVIFSGVKAVKEVVRERALELEPFLQMPKLTLSVNNKSLIIQDSFHLNAFTVQPDSISIALSIGSDMDLVSWEGFKADLLSGGTLTADLPQGTTQFYIVDVNLVDEECSITASIYPPKSQQALSRTYMDTTLKSVVNDLSKEMGVEIECKVDGKIDYFKAFSSPVQCLRALQTGAGFLVSYRQGKITCANIPDSLDGRTELEFSSMEEDSNKEPINGLYWYDGVNQFTAGTLDSTAQYLYSSFRSSQNYSQNCLKYAHYMNNVVVVETEIPHDIDSHSVVYIQSNDKIIHCMVEWYTFDYITNMAKLELHYVG